MRIFRAIEVASLTIGLMLGASAAGAAPGGPDLLAPALDLPEDSRVCGIETLRQEKALAIPDRLLHAISLVESGRWDNDQRASFAWPWTVTAEGEGRFLPSKTAAIDEVKRLEARGIANIDVGCMQVNLQAHPDAFASLDEAFDPAGNVAYGARFLAELRASTPDWETAGAYYHSQTPMLAAAYKTKLVAAWKAARAQPDPRGDRPAIETASAAPANDIRPPIGMVLPTPAQVPDRKALLAAVVASSQAASADVAAKGAAALARTQAEHAEAKRIADAYRNARMAEYRAHKLQMADQRG